MSDTPQVIASLTAAPEASRLAELGELAQVLEVRADLFPEPDVDWLRSHFPGRLLYTLRSEEEGGAHTGGVGSRQTRLAAAAKRYDLVDLETRDLDESLLASVPASRRVLSWHGTPDGLEELQEVAERLLGYEAGWYKLVNMAQRSGHDRWPLSLLHDLGRRDVIAFAAGEVGVWTRLVAPLVGSPAIFAAAGPEPAAPGQLPVERVLRDYGWPPPAAVRWLFGVVGRPVAHSLSPYLYNRALREVEMAALYVPFHVDSFGEFWLEVVEEGGFAEAGCSLRGLSVTSPCKRIAVAVAGATSPLAERIGSANTLVYHDGVWEAESTDPEGVLGPLRRRHIVVRDLPAAVLGAGGAGRAAAFALAGAGAEVTLFNRDPERGARAARDLGLPCAGWRDFAPGEFAIVVQATSLGRSDEDSLPCEPRQLREDAVGIDLVYRHDGMTPWIRALRDCDRLAVDGREVLLHQAIPQFAAMTGREMPRDLVAELLAELEAA